MGKNYSFIVVCLIACLCASCGSENKSQNDDIVGDTILTDTKHNLVGMINGTIYCLPSPYEIMNHVQGLNLPYDASLPNSELNFNMYESSFKKLMNMGVYGIDISYMALYGQTNEALNYFATLKSLANQIDLADIFDAETMERFEENMDNQDSLLQIITDKFRDSNRLLKEENQKAEAALIMTGCWIESLYLLTRFQKFTPSDMTVQKIAEHKFAAEAIVNILRPYAEKSSDYTDLVYAIVDICYDFDGIDYKYTYKPSTIYSNSHVTVLNSESELVVLPEHIALISEKIEKLRNTIIQ